jgi:DNA-binding PadR family transcriptional regulator
MYRDNTLIPTEAIRLAALGQLAGAPSSFAALARDVRAFAARITGPSLDLLGSSLELLRYEGLVELLSGDDRVRLTDAGRTALLDLLRANVRSPVDAVSKLILALKLRFLHLLPADERPLQIAQMIEASKTERARIAELAARHHGEPGHLPAFLAHDLSQVDARIQWLEGLMK